MARRWVKRKCYYSSLRCFDRHLWFARQHEYMSVDGFHDLMYVHLLQAAIQKE